MFKRFFTLIVCAFIMSCNLELLIAKAEEKPELYNIPIVSNEINQKFIVGYLYDDELFFSVEDICKLTRSTCEISNQQVNIVQGIREIKIDLEHNKIKFGNQTTEFIVNRYNDKILVKPHAILSLLCANIDYSKVDNSLLVLMPSITIYEAMQPQLYSKCHYNIYDDDAFSTIVRMYASSFSDLFFDGYGNFFNKLPDIMSFHGADSYIDNALIEISKVDIYNYNVLEKSINNNLKKRTEIIDSLKNTSDYAENINSISSDYKDILETTIGNSDAFLNAVLEKISLANNFLDLLSFFKGAEEKLNYNIDSFKLISKVLTQQNIGNIKGSDALIERADIVGYDLSLRESAYAEQFGNKLYDEVVEKTAKEIGNLTSINEFSLFLKTYDIGANVTKILMNDKFKAWDSDINAIMISDIQNILFDAIKQSYYMNESEGFSDYEHINSLIDSINLYNRTTIAMFSNLKISNDEFQMYEKSFSDTWDSLCEESAENSYNLYSCNLKKDICSLDEFKNNYNNNIAGLINVESCDKYKELNYTWHLDPTIEADDIIVSDEYNKDNSDSMIEPYDKCAIIQQNGKYGIIKYDGSYIAESKYNKYFCDGVYEMSVFNEYRNSTQNVNVFPSENELNIEVNYEGWRGNNEYKYIYDLQSKQIYNLDSHSSGATKYTENSCVVVECYDFDIIGEYDKENNQYKIKEHYEKIDSSKTKYGIAKGGKLLVQCEYEDGCMNFSDGIVALKKDGKWGFFDEEGNKIIDFICESFPSKIIYGGWWKNSDNMQYPFLSSNGYIPVKINGKCGYYDTQGNEVIPCGTFEEVRPVHNGLAWVKKDGKWGVIELDSVEEEKDTTVTKFNVNWQEIYAEELRGYLNSKEYMSDSMFDVFDIDGDDIPELVISDSAVHMGTCKIYTISNGNLVKPNDERYGSCGVVYCSEKLHMLYGDYLQQGRFTFSFYQLTKNGVERILSGYNDEYAVFDETPTYQIDGENVTKEKYEEAYHKYNLEDFEEVGRKYELNESMIASVLLGGEVAELTEEAKTISDIEILWAVNKYLEENQSHLGDFLSNSGAYCSVQNMASNDTNWSCPIDNYEYSYSSSNYIAGSYPYYAFVDKETMVCTITANYYTEAEFDLTDYIN